MEELELIQISHPVEFFTENGDSMVKRTFLLVLMLVFGLSPVDEAILVSSGWSIVPSAPLGTPVQEEDEEHKYTNSVRSQKRASASASWEASTISSRSGPGEKLAQLITSPALSPRGVHSFRHNGFGGFLRC